MVSTTVCFVVGLLVLQCLGASATSEPEQCPSEAADEIGLLQVAGLPAGDHSPQGILTCPKSVQLKTKCLSKNDYKSITGGVKELFYGLDSTCNHTHCPQADWAGCVLRLAGHDFMDFDGHCKGGSDGCLNFQDPDNKGLRACLADGEHGASLQQVYSEVCQFVSLADFIVMAGEAVMHATRKLYIKDTGKSHEQLDFAANFRFGRKTANSCLDALALPDPERGCDAVQETFGNRLGLDWEHTAALMAVHTLGRAQVANSGYSGWWSSPENSRHFNNNYFIKMLGNGWMPQHLSEDPPRNQWQLADDSSDVDRSHHMMLNTDLCLVYTNAKTFDEVGVPINAARDDCCAWTASRRIREAIALVDGAFCGGAPSETGGEHMLLDGGDEEHKLCCHSAEPEPEEEEQEGEQDEGVPHKGRVQAAKSEADDDPEDCGDFFHPEGPAAEHVIKFANDESFWLKRFQAAWKQATENGAKDLKELKDRCYRR